MRHTRIDNVDYVIAREWPDRGFELVAPDGTIRHEKTLSGPITTFERPIVPEFVQNEYEPRVKLLAIRLQRLELLVQARKTSRRRKPGDPDTKPKGAKGTPAPRIKALPGMTLAVTKEIAKTNPELYAKLLGIKK